jgi:OTU domain-containing protein 6
MDALLSRHALEISIFESSVRQLAPKPRFGKAPSAEAIERAEASARSKRVELDLRHRSELDALSAAPPPIEAAAPVLAAAIAPAERDASDGEDDGSDGAGAAESAASRKGKAARRRERKEARLASERAAALGADASSAGVPSAREAEMESLERQLLPLGFTIAPITGDGHCLFRAVAAQMALAGGSGDSVNHVELRRRAAQVIRTFWEDYAPFLPYEASDDYREEAPAALAAVGRYCDRLATTNAWGGHPEIRALAHATGCSVLVYRAGSEALEFKPRGDETARSDASAPAAARCVRISFHVHYGASEHYNSVVKVRQ